MAWARAGLELPATSLIAPFLADMALSNRAERPLAASDNKVAGAAGNTSRAASSRFFAGFTVGVRKRQCRGGAARARPPPRQRNLGRLGVGWARLRPGAR